MQQRGGSYFPKLTGLLEQIQIKDQWVQPRFILGRPKPSEGFPQFALVLFFTRNVQRFTHSTQAAPAARGGDTCIA